MVLASMALFALVPFPAPRQAFPNQQPALPGYLLGITDVAEALTADMDGDGNQDLVTFSANASEVRVHLGNGAGSFVQDAIPGTSAPESVTLRGGVTADFDGDGDLDLALIGDVVLEGRLFTWLNDGSGVLTLNTAMSFQKGGTLLTAIDVEGDGWSDLMVRRSASPFLQVLRSQGPAGFSAPKPIALPAGYVGLSGYAAGDVNGDGRPDLLTVNAPFLPESSKAFLHANDGQGGFDAPVQVFEVPLFTSQLLLADLRGDGVLHAATNAIDQQESAVSWFENDGSGSFTPRQSFDGLRFPTSLAKDVCVRDLDGNGREEWMVQLPSGNLGRLVAQGTQVELDDVELVLPSNWLLTAGDFDSDGAEDLTSLWGAWASPIQPCLMLSDGSGGQRGTIVSADVPSGTVPSLFDLDGDGQLDLVVRDFINEALHLFRGVHGGHFEWIQTVATIDRSISLAFGDFDGDGRTDLGVGEGPPYFVELFLQDSSGAFRSAGSSTPVETLLVVSPGAVHALDSDADGRDEIAYIEPTLRSVIVVGLDDASIAQDLGRLEIPFWASIHGVTDSAPGVPQALELLAPGSASSQSLWVLANLLGRTPPKLVERLALPEPPFAAGWAGLSAPEVDDFDGDGLLDVWNTNFKFEWPYLSASSVWSGLPGGGFDAPSVDRSPYGLVPQWSGDVDGDGATDFVYLNGTFDYMGLPYLDRLQVHRPALGQPLGRPELYPWTTHAHGDVNGDGRTDLVVIQNGKVVTLLGGVGR